MLSHLRFHRRGPSTPASPVPEQAPAWDTVAQREHPQPPHHVSQRPDARPRSPNSSHLPPTLPPIPRVASTPSDHLFTPPNDALPSSHDTRQPPARPVNDKENKGGFMGGMALQNFRRTAHGPQGSDAGTTVDSQLPENQLSRAKAPPPPINTGQAARPAMPVDRQTKSSWFSMPTDLQGQGGAGKRPAGSRLASDPAPAPPSEPPKGRKGLPFLKNPMSSLLMRRKTAHTAMEAQPPAPSYDPRIKGTRVHDFSAPRPKKPISIADTTPVNPATTPTTDSASRAGETASLTGEPASDAATGARPGPDGDAQLTQETTRPSSSTSRPTPPSDDLDASIHTSSSAASRVTQVAPLPPASASVRTTASRQLSRISRGDSVASAIPRHMKSTSSRFSFDMIGAAEQEKLLEERHRQREQDKKTSDDPTYGDTRFDDFDEDFDYDAMMDDDGLEERIPGVNADYEYEEELEEDLDGYIDPDNDQENFAGFAFQRSNPEPAEDDDLDPDNDQENFAGFAFQRSNPTSSLASPHAPGMLATPRDASGKVIGFAMTKDTTPELPTSQSPMFPGPVVLPEQDDHSGLGIQGPDPHTEEVAQEPVFRPSYVPATGPPPPLRSENDDIYFDDGLADELDFEHDGTVFDESIFDNNDTDRYGRPIPGAFAQAKEAMQAGHQQPSKRGSDITSASGQLGVAHSTGQTSLDVGPRQPTVHREEEEKAMEPAAEPAAEPEMAIQDPDLAYQAALAEAAQIAAASGKFRRSSSPEALAGLADTTSADLAEYEDLETSGYVDDYGDNYGDDFTNDFDDFDFDDEAIIAEANASALANDSDGFYGHEFGFYSTPLTHPPPSHQPPATTATATTTNTATPSSNVLTTENLFQYANGGYFGPPNASTLDRSTSGRVVREPNLTPITERSEYSNRNSVMSFTLPPAIGSGDGGAAGGRNSASLSMNSPGLAQLALLPPDHDGESMSLSALMKLRSKAWGGSQASLGSSGGGGGSPRSERAVSAALDGGGGGYGTVPAHLAGHGVGHGHGHGHVRVGSGLSLWSCSEAAEEGGAGFGGGWGSGAGSPAAGATSSLSMAMGMGLGMASAPGSGQGSMVILPPRPGSAGAVVNGGGAGGGLNGLMGSPLPPRPQSMFLPPPTQAPPPIPSPNGASQQVGGGMACSPVLEGEEADADEVAAAGGFTLAPALPLRMGSLASLEASSGEGVDETTSQHQHQRRPGMGHRHKGSADSVSYMKEDEGGGSTWVVERRRTAESGEVEVLAREVVAGGRI